jgi:hypothetical protein
MLQKYSLNRLCHEKFQCGVSMHAGIFKSVLSLQGAWPITALQAYGKHSGVCKDRIALNANRSPLTGTV